METQKIVNLLNGSDNENSKFATKKWYVIDSESKGVYSHENPIKFLTSSLESSFCDYSDAYILVKGNIAVTGGNKVELSLKWYENFILSSAGTATTFEITDTKLYVPVAPLKTEDNVK